MDIKYKLEVTINEKTKKVEGESQIDFKKWNKIQELCDYQKVSIYELIEEYLEKLTVEEAETIIYSWDM